MKRTLGRRGARGGSGSEAVMSRRKIDQALAAPPSAPAGRRTSSTGTGAVRAICSASLPISTRARPRRPWVRFSRS
eukprot:gene18860-26705_t